MADTDILGKIAPGATIGLGLLETGLNIAQQAAAKKRQRKLLSQRKAYQTPDEIFRILQATQGNLGTGFDPATLDYLTSQTDQSFSSGLDVLERLGGNPNDVSALFHQKVNEIMKIGGQDQQLKMEKFSQYLNALDVVAANKSAEQKSQQDIIKDQLQAEGLNIQNATSNIGSGLSAVLAGLSAAGIAGLYNEDGTLKKKKTRINTLAVDNTYQGVGSNFNMFG